MKNTVIIKGNRYGISIVLDKETEFSKLLEDLALKLENAEEFFDCERQLAVTFEGRNLSNEELDQVLSVIKDNSRLNIQYVMDENSDLEATFFDIIQTAKTVELEEKKPESELIEVTAMPDIAADPSDLEEMESLPEKGDNTGMFYKGTLRSGQTLETKDSLVIIGDVNPGAKVIAGGNIVIIGALKGSVAAGSTGNTNAFVMALSMEPIQIQIADVLARSSDAKKVSKSSKEAMIASIVNNQICIDPISKTAIQDIHF